MRALFLVSLSLLGCNQAQPSPQFTVDVRRLECNREYTHVSASDTLTQTSQYYQAEIDLPGVSIEAPPVSVSVLLCDRVDANDNDECSDGYSCTGRRPEPLHCFQGGYKLDNGKLAVSCGMVLTSRHAATNYAPARTNVNGDYYRRAIVTIVSAPQPRAER